MRERFVPWSGSVSQWANWLSRQYRELEIWVRIPAKALIFFSQNYHLYCLSCHVATDYSPEFLVVSELCQMTSVHAQQNSRQRRLDVTRAGRRVLRESWPKTVKQGRSILSRLVENRRFRVEALVWSGPSNNYGTVVDAERGVATHIREASRILDVDTTRPAWLSKLYNRGEGTDSYKGPEKVNFTVWT